MAYVLGYFAADGSLILNKRGGRYIEFTSTDRILLQKILSTVNGDQKISKRPQRNKRWKRQYRLQFGSKAWFADLSALGFTQRKSKTVTLPAVPKKYFPHFVRGYFDGDGNVYFKKHYVKARQKKRWVFSTRFTSGSRSFLSALHEKLKTLGLQKGFILKKHNERGFELIFSHHDSLALYDLIYHTAPITELFLPRKYTLFSKATQTLFPMRW